MLYVSSTLTTVHHVPSVEPMDGDGYGDGELDLAELGILIRPSVHGLGGRVQPLGDREGGTTLGFARVADGTERRQGERRRNIACCGTEMPGLVLD